jgi:surface carbohydrate biosynthesis protein (TIGR04326 family)
MKPSLTIWDSDKRPSNNVGNVYTWNGYEESESIFSLPKYIEEHDIELRRRYMAWVYDLSLKEINNKSLIEIFLLKKDFSYWWMTNFIEQSMLKSPNIPDVIKIFSLEKILKELTPKSVILVSSNRALVCVIEDLCKDLDIHFISSNQQNKRVNLSFINNFRIIFLEIIKSIVVFLSYLKTLALLKVKRKEKRKFEPNSLFVVTYFTNFCTKKAIKGNFYSHYWGQLHNLLKDMAINVNWLHIYQNNVDIPTNQAKNLISNFNNNASLQVHNLLESYCTKDILFEVIKSWLKISKARQDLDNLSTIFCPRESNYSLWPLVQNDWNSSLIGSNLILNLFYFELFNNLLKSIPHQNAGIYLFENQSWERAFVYLWKKHGHGKLLGVAHTFVRFWDLRYFNDRRFFELSDVSLMPKPDLIVLNGRNAIDTYRRSNTYSTFAECEALRYGFLSDINKIRKSNRGRHTSSLNILILAEYSINTSKHMLSNVSEAIELIDRPVSLSIKPHPATVITKDKHSFLEFNIITDPLPEIMPLFDLVITGSLTVASLDVFLSGIPLIIILDQKKLNFSPLRGTKDVCFVSTMAELKRAIDSCQNPTNFPDIKDFFKIDNDLPSWKKILSESLI